ncbi:MaoC family dehydratase [Zavarzinia sp. CC-PAN008]|uniref:MaoC family dehydratase n=1 Tax=Zavarzinia sp. CC-PAN008 TaxID=3243332 RepID=UPI003F7477A2
MTRYFDDFKVGERTVCGSYTVTAEEIIRFASDFDPQSFHIDAEAAEDSFFGGLVASGWHSACIMMRLMITATPQENRGAFIASPGFEDLRWWKPVHPGDTLTVVTEVKALQPSKSKSDRGVVLSQNTVTNQKGEVVLTMTGKGMYLRRPAGEGGSA